MKFQPPNEDLFKDSTMTFGEHLEELRICLFRALIGLVIGICIGLLLGQQIVLLVQKPLVDALEGYYAHKAEKNLPAYLSALRDSRQTLGFTEKEAIAAIQHGLVPERVYVSRQSAETARAKPSVAATDEEATSDQTAAALNLVPMLIWRPSTEIQGVRPTTLSAQEAFSIWIKASVVAGIIISSPWVFYQLWAFVAAGLYPNEKHYVHVFLPFSLGLFLAGAALAFFFVFKPVLDFLIGFNQWLGLDPDPRISEWFSFVLILPLGFGISFQLPLVMLFLDRIGIFSVQMYLEKWRIAIFAITVISAVLTPADPYSIFLMAIPLIVLYFGGVALCHYLPRRKSPYDEDE